MYIVLETPSRKNTQSIHVAYRGAGIRKKTKQYFSLAYLSIYIADLLCMCIQNI